MRRTSVGTIVGVALAVLMTLGVIQPAQAAQQPSGEIRVSAASSLTDVLPVIARAFEQRYPGTKVRFNFAGSSTLVNQVIEGAPVDVIATASEATMGKAVKSGAVLRPVPFARNTMTIALPPGNPARIRSLADLGRRGVLVGVCDAAVPCGTAARDLLARARIPVTPVTRELDVRALLGKVMSGDLDAGIVYVTDVRAVGRKVASVPIPANVNVTTTYPIAAVRDARNPTGARAFVDYVRADPTAQGILRAAGFTRP